MNQFLSFRRRALLGAFLVIFVSLGGLSSAAGQRESSDIQEAMERVRLYMQGCGADTTPDPKLAARRAAAAETARVAAGRPD